MPHIGNHVDAIFIPESVNTSTTLRVNGGDLHLDDDKKLLLGNSDDLQIYYDGSNSYIEDVGPGQFYIRGSAALHLESADGTKKYARFVNSGAAELYHDGTKAFETTSTGIDVPLGTITGPATLNIDPAAVGDNTGTVVIKGDLQVDGTTTTINSTTLTVDDKNIVLASGAADSAAADGAGITIDGADAHLFWIDGNKSFRFDKRLGIGSGTSVSSNLRLSRDIGGENTTVYYAFLNNGLIQPDVTGTAYYNFVQVRTDGNDGTGYTISNLEGYSASVGNGTVHADTTITNLVGFEVKNTWTAGTNNYGFKGEIDTVANTNRWNVYMSGTAPNYFNGRVGIGTNTPRGELDIYQPSGQATTVFIEGGSPELWFKDVDETSIFRQIINANGWNVQPGTGSVASPTWSGVALNIDGNGNVGIGTNNPTEILHIAGNNSVQQIKYGHNSTGYFLSNTEVNRANANSAIHNYHYRWNGTKVAQMSVMTGDDTTNKDNGYFVFETASAGTTAERLRITADGNIGINTESPEALLDVNGGNLVVQNTVGNSITLRTHVGNGNDSTFVFQKSRGGAGTIADVQNGDDIGTISFSGYYGSAYQTESTIRAEAIIDPLNPVYSDRMLYDSNTHLFRTSNSTRMTILDNGHVGIGTNAPEKPLHIYFSTDEILRFETADNQVGNMYHAYHDASGELARIGIFNSLSELRITNLQSDGVVTLRTNDAERMRIDSSGNVGIGINSPSEKLDVAGVAMASLLVDSVYASETWPAGDNTLAGNDLGTWTLTGGLLETPTNGADDYHMVDTANLPDGLNAITWVSNNTTSYLTSPNINITNLRTNTGIFGGIGGFSSGTDRTVADSRIYLTVLLAAQSMDSSSEYLEVELSSDGGTTWVPDVAFVSQDSDQDNDDITDTYWRKVVIDISEYSSSTFQIRFKGTGTGAGDGYGVSNIYIHEAPIPNRLQAKTLKLGDGKITNSTYEHSNALTLISSGGTSKLIVLEDDGNPRQNYIGINQSDNLEIAADEDNAGNDSQIRFRIDGKERMKLYTSTDANASVAHLQLIGHATPTDRSNWRITAQDDGTHGYLTISDYSGGSWRTNFAVHESGNVGIGTTDPGSLLHLNSDNSTIHINTNRDGTNYRNAGILFSTPRNNSTDGNSHGGRGAIINLGNSSSAGGIQWMLAATASLSTNDNDATLKGKQCGLRLDSGGNIEHWVANSLIMRSQGDGNVGIGTAVAGHKLDVYGNMVTENGGSFGRGTLTADGQNNIHFFSQSASTNQAQSGAFHNKVRILGGSSQTRTLDLYQVDSGGAHIGSSYNENNLTFDSDFTFVEFDQQVIIDSDNNVNGALRINNLVTNAEHDFYFAQEIVQTLSGSQTTTADREQGGIYMDINSTTTGGDTNHEHRAYGMYVDLDSSGDADAVYGVYSTAVATPTEGTTTEVAGLYGYGEDNGGAGGVTNVYGVRGLAVSDNSTSDSNALFGGHFKAQPVSDTGTIGGAYGVYAEIEIANNTGDHLGDSFVVRAVYDDNDDVAQSNNTYLFHGDYTGTNPTNSWGVYIADGICDNYFAGSLGIGTANPTQKLHVVGNAYIGDGTDISPDANGAGHLTINASGYTPYITADATAMYVGHNSSARQLRFQTNEATRMYIRADGSNVGIGTTHHESYVLSLKNVTSETLTGGIFIDCNEWSSNTSEYGINVDVDSTNRTNLSANRTHRGISADVAVRVAQNASSTSGTRQSAYGVYGRVIFNDTDDNDGKIYYAWGGVFTGRVDGVNASNVRGSYSLGQCADNATGSARTVDNVYGAFNLAINDGNETTITNAYATYSHVNQDDAGGTMTNAYGVYSRVDRDSGTGGTGYAYRGIFEGTWTTKRGLWITGDTENSVAGSFTASSKNFRIRHPLPELSETKDLVHVSVEAPAHDLIYRGKSELVNGSATINLDTKFRMTEGTFVALNRNIQCFTSNESDWSSVRGSVSGNILTIECQDSSSTATVSWMVIGERQDDRVKSLVTTDADGNLILEPDKEPEDEDQGKPEIPD